MTMREQSPQRANGARRDAALAPSQPSDMARKGRTRPRLPEFDYTGRYAYHFELSTNHRARVLEGSTAESTITDLQRASRATSFELLAYCVMPDHVHVLALGTSDSSDAVLFMQRFKQLTGFRFAKTHDKPFWQQSFYDHVARLEEDLLPIARYILDNPVVAGLVSEDDDCCVGAVRCSRRLALRRRRGTELKLRPYGLRTIRVPRTDIERRAGLLQFRNVLWSRARFRARRLLCR